MHCPLKNFLIERKSPLAISWRASRCAVQWECPIQIERLLVSKKELKALGIPYCPQDIARLEKAGLFPKRIIPSSASAGSPSGALTSGNRYGNVSTRPGVRGSFLSEIGVGRPVPTRPLHPKRTCRTLPVALRVALPLLYRQGVPVGQRPKTHYNSTNSDHSVSRTSALTSPSFQQ